MTMRLSLHPRSPSTGRALSATLLLAAAVTVIAGVMAARYGPHWPRRAWYPRPPGVILHHSASSDQDGSGAVNAAAIDRWHQARGWGVEGRGGEYHIGYHYVILPDGTVEEGRPEWMRGAHTLGHNDTIGVCLVGNFSSSADPEAQFKPHAPTPEQLDALHGLLLRLLRKYRLSPASVLSHGDVAATACPGDRFPYDAVMQRLRDDLEAHSLARGDP